MKGAVWMVWLAVVSAAAVSTVDADDEHKFATWMALYAMRFSDAHEYATRLETFVANDRFIMAHNQHRGTRFLLGHNAYSHLTFAEFAANKKGLRVPPKYVEQREAAARNTSDGDVHRRPIEVEAEDVPESVDWVAKGGVTAVKNQGQCGSCWAFSTTGAVEGAAFVASGKLVSLSEQELVDCDHDGDQGCSGGLMDHAFHWIQKHHGICAEADYEYHAAVEQCRTCEPVVKVTGFKDVPPNDEVALQRAVAKQPVAVAIEADQREFQFYKSGVFDLECGTQLDHGVLVVGYGAEPTNGKKFWKVKNSWGATWGEGGYIRLSRDMGRASGQCGVAMAPSYPTATMVSAAADSVGGPEQALERYDLAIQQLEEQLLAVEPEEPCVDGLTMMEENAEAQGAKQGVYEYFEEGM